MKTKSKNQLAAIARWAKISKDERSERARKMVKARYAKTTPEERKAQARKQAMARWHPETAQK